MRGRHLTHSEPRSPEQIACRKEKVKIPISLSKASYDFFKEQAHLHKTVCQKMIRNLLDAYALKAKAIVGAVRELNQAFQAIGAPAPLPGR